MSEREFHPSEALLRIKAIIHSLGFHAAACYVDRERLIATAELFDRNSILIGSGAGKGPDSLIGALAESIEHFSTFHPPINKSIAQRCDFIASQAAAKHDGLLKSLPLTDQPIDCFKLTELKKQKYLFVPSILLCPRITREASEETNSSSRYLSRYSSNSGIAFGCTEAEALLHGALEVTERHILSLFFMAICGIRPAMNLYTPSTELLTKALQSNQSALNSANKLQIIIIKDVMGVYFSVALPKAGAGDLHLSPIGSGCSLDICIAIQRAVTEQFQSSILYGVEEEQTDKKALELLSSSKTLKHLIDFEPIRNTKLATIECPKTDLTLSVPQQLTQLQSSLSDSGRSLFQRTITRYNNGIVSQSYIPGLERFNIIRNGSPVAPQHILNLS